MKDVRPGWATYQFIERRRHGRTRRERVVDRLLAWGLFGSVAACPALLIAAVVHAWP